MNGGSPFTPERGIDAGHDALAGGFFIPAGSVDLASKVEAFHALHAQAAIELGGVDRVVFDGISGAQHLGIFEAGDGTHDLPLHFHRQRGRHAVDVDLVRIQAFRFEEELMLRLVGELDDLVFDGRAIARADALDLAGVHRRAMHIFANDAQRFRSGEGDVAADLRLHDLLRAEAEGSRLGIARLLFEASQSMVRPSRRGGVPVFSLQCAGPSARRASPRRTEAGSPLRPAG